MLLFIQFIHRPGRVGPQLRRRLQAIPGPHHLAWSCSSVWIHPTGSADLSLRSDLQLSPW